MKAMILAAGLGTRLKPMTDKIPKALVEINGSTLLEQSLNHLKDYNITEVIINVHHFADQIRDYLLRNHNFGMKITLSDESEQLLDTGGGLKKAAWFFNDGRPFLVRNVDVISDIDIFKLQRHHDQNSGLATLVVRDRVTSRYLLFNEGLQLCGWENVNTGEKKITRENQPVMKRFAFSGLQIIEPAMFELISEQGTFSLTEMYLRLSADHRIVGFVDKESFWLDAGKAIPGDKVTK